MVEHTFNTEEIEVSNLIIAMMLYYSELSFNLIRNLYYSITFTHFQIIAESTDISSKTSDLNSSQYKLLIPDGVIKND